MKKSAQLTQEQLKNSISSKQSKVKLKNVLASPYPKYWPLLQKNSIQTLTNILKTILPGEHPGEKKRISVNRNHMLYGLPCVHRSLKTGRVDSLLLSTSIEPRFVLQQIIQLAFAKRKDLKVICVEKLEDILKDVGIKSIAVGLIKQCDNNPYSSLHDFISKESERFVIPEDFIRDPPSTENRETERKKPRSLLQSNFQPEDLYLRKNQYSRNRVFVPKTPEHSPESSHSDSCETSEGDSMSEEEMPKTKAPKTPMAVASSLTNLSISSKAIRKMKSKRSKLLKKKSAYLPLVINRIAPNPTKLKKRKGKKCKKSK